MASKSNFIGEFRQTITIAQQAFAKAKDMVAMATALGWDETALAGEFTSSDISAAEFVAAMGSITALASANAAQAPTLLKLRP
jgi:hypothetical protein